jgi:hypothetical protein
MSSHGRIQISFVLQICVPNSVTLSLAAPCYVKITTYLQTTQLYCTVIRSLHVLYLKCESYITEQDTHCVVIKKTHQQTCKCKQGTWNCTHSAVFPSMLTGGVSKIHQSHCKARNENYSINKVWLNTADVIASKIAHRYVTITSSQQIDSCFKYRPTDCTVC